MHLAGVLHLRLAPLGAPSCTSQILGEARKSVTASGPRAQLLSLPLLGSGSLRLPGAGAASWRGARELRQPRLRTVMPGLGAGALPPSPRARSLAPALLPAPSPLLPQPCRLRTADPCRPPRAWRLPRCSAGSLDPRALLLLSRDP